MLLLAAALFFAEPVPVEMPQARAYYVRDGERRWLEDRYDTVGLWLSRAIDGCWRDGDGREFLVGSLGVLPTPLANEAPATRLAYGATETKLDYKDKDQLFNAVDRLSPIPPDAEFAKPRQGIRGLKEVRYYNGTNTAAIVCAYLPEKEKVWRFASWTLAKDDVYADRLKAFEDEFLADAKVRRPVELKTDFSSKSERELLRADARHSVAAFPNWRVTDSDEFTVLDDLTVSRSFITTLTNDLKVSRAKYAATVPSPLDGSNVLAVARIFANRTEYLKALEANDHDDMDWSAAYWNPSRRELVAYLPEDGGEKLLETIRHEAFHQYLSYAAAMIPAAPWFNEGYAQYFEDTESAKWDIEVDLDLLASMIPDVIRMDYEAFYAGNALERQLKYRLAWSIARFLEKGAPKVRFEPFKDVKRDYLASLLEKKDMHAATEAAFKSADNLKLFISEWKKFWEKE